jgi:hypothetical protein
MAIIPRGTPVRYRDINGHIFAGLVYSDNGVDPDIIYFGSEGQWVATGGISTRDDSGATNNSYAIVGITSQFEGT